MTRKRKQELPDWDDGRTIVSMDVEGMPWNHQKSGRLIPRAEEERKTTVPGEPMNREESRYYTWGAMKAALAIVGVMCAGLILFVLFCQFVWFR